MTHTHRRLTLEFVALYLVLPVFLFLIRHQGIPLPVLPALWCAAGPAAYCLVRRHNWDLRAFFALPANARRIGTLALRAALAGAVLTGTLWLTAPDSLFELPRRNPRLWAIVMTAYPVLSVFPQGILYRALFFTRYAVLFQNRRAAWLASAVVFSLAHLLFNNFWALAWTLLGGLLINRSYLRHGSLMAAAAEHAVYGQCLFTCGWGRFLYHGTTGLAESLIP